VQNATASAVVYGTRRAREERNIAAIAAAAFGAARNHVDGAANAPARKARRHDNVPGAA